jgi:glycosyltransferase involved in cell wall biosynthesis
MKKLTVTVGIPAYNEEASIRHLIKSILSQSREHYLLKKIIVVSDGSTDKTVEICEMFEDKKVQCIKRSERGGKTTRMNELFKMVKTDVLIILDADIQLGSDTTLDNLVENMLFDKRIVFSFGRSVPAKPKNAFGNIVFTGIAMFDRAVAYAKSDLYVCSGAIRAFSKKLYTKLRMPKTSSEDVYPYLYCLTRGYKYDSVPHAIALYNLPDNLKDYRKQIKRYLKSRSIHTNSFGKKVTDSAYTMTLWMKVLAFAQVFLIKPFTSLLYLALISITRIERVIERDNRSIAIWEIATSSKRIGVFSF